MNKEEITRRRGDAAYKKMQEQWRQWYKANPEKFKERVRQWQEANPDKKRDATRRWRKANPEVSRKGGKYYLKMLKYKSTGLQGERNRIRTKHGNKWREYKKIIAPGSQIHHEWIFETADFRGVALVEADQHRHGIIDVIEILDGKITLLFEENYVK